ncbi:MAG: methylated-DNA--[protein]-cysteine S-methyltransferase [Nitrospirota bacterium]|nr:methylated-DNA--[protein]-cysteine S-methyltransferase [Nitrospirota bacterium]
MQRIQAAGESNEVGRRVFHTHWGWAGIAVSPKGVTRLVLPRSSRARVARELGSAEGPSGEQGRTLLSRAQTQVAEFLAGTRRALDLPMDLSEGTPFQRKVWRVALAIPYGRVRSYKWIADRLGGTRYARAVGTALGANPVPILVPCHRVVAQDGSLGGFSGGLPVKRKLLTLEGTLSQLKS